MKGGNGWYKISYELIIIEIGDMEKYVVIPINYFYVRLMYSRRQKQNSRVGEFGYMHYWTPAKWQMMRRAHDELRLLGGRPRESGQTVHLTKPCYRDRFNSAISWTWHNFSRWDTIRDSSEPWTSLQIKHTVNWKPSNRTLVQRPQRYKPQTPAFRMTGPNFHSFCVLFLVVLTIWSYAGLGKKLANMLFKSKKIYSLGDGAKHKRW